VSDPLVRELAALAAAGTDPERIADVASQVLASRYEPGFDAEPALLATLEGAMEAVRADLRATGLPGPLRLVVPEWAGHRNAFAEFRGHGYGSTSGIAPAEGADPVSALVAVADGAQDAIMETLFQVWPVCPAHKFGAHARRAQDVAVWWCNGAAGHVIAPIGRWPLRRRDSRR
jgi:hypothetical protein